MQQATSHRQWFSHWVMSDSCNPMNCYLPGSPVHEIFQARILEWVATSSSRRSSPPMDQTLVSCVSCIGKQILYHRATRELFSLETPNQQRTWLSKWCIGKESSHKAEDAGDSGSNPQSVRSPWRRKWQRLQFSCLKNPTDRRARLAIVHRVTKSQERLSN